MVLAESELGLLAAALAPALSALGLTTWDKTWRGSCFMLNLGKCSVAASWFVLVAISTDGLVPFLTR